MAITRLQDTFTDANGTALGSHAMNVGGGWTVHNGSYEIQSNRAAQWAAPAAPGNLATADAGVADSVITLDVIAGTAGNSYGAALRYASGLFYVAFITPTNNLFRIMEWTGAAFVLRATATVTINTGSTYALSITLAGAVITATVNGGSQIQYSSATTNQTSTMVGLRAPDNVGSFDNFLVVSATAPAMMQHHHAMLAGGR